MGQERAANLRRAASLAAVAEWTSDRRTLHLNVADFVDEFWCSPAEQKLAEEHPRLAGVYDAGDVGDAYLAAVAGSLAREIREPPPAWAEDRKLRRPRFAWPGAISRAKPLHQRQRPVPGVSAVAKTALDEGGATRYQDRL